MALEAASKLTPDKLSADLNDLADLADALCIVTDAKGDGRQEGALHTLAGIIAERLDGLYVAMQETREIEAACNKPAKASSKSGGFS